MLLIDLRGTHSLAIDSKAKGEQKASAKTTANQTAAVQSPKVRQIDDVVTGNGRETLKGIIDDQTTHLFFGEANSFANNGRTFPADTFGTLLTNQEAGTDHSADASVIILTTNEPSQEVQAGTIEVPVFELQPQPNAEEPTGDSRIVDSVSESVAESQLDSIIEPNDHVQDETTGELIAISRIDESSPEIQNGGQVSPLDETTNVEKSDSFVTDDVISETTGETGQSTDGHHITHVQETEIAVGDHLAPFPANSGEPGTFQMEHKGDFAVEMNPNTNERVNVRSKTATNLNLSGAGRHLPMVKVKHVFNIRVQPFRPSLPIAQRNQGDSSVEFVQLETGPFQPEPQVPDAVGLARTEEESSLGNVDSFVPEDIAGPVQFQVEPINVDVDRVIGTPDEVPIDPVVDQVSPAEQGTNSGGTDSFIVISSAEQFHNKDTDVGVILAIRPQANVATGIFQTAEDVGQTIPIQPEMNEGRADDFVNNTEMKEETLYQPETNIGESHTATDSFVGQTEPRTEMTDTTGYQTETDQPADGQNQISDERAMRSAFASSSSRRSNNGQRPINRHMIDGDVDEPSISIEFLDREPNHRVGANQAATHRNRTVVVEVDDGFVSSEIIGHIDENRKIHLSRPTQEQQERPSMKAARLGGNRQEGKLRTVTIEQIQAAVNKKHSDEMRDDSSAERAPSQNSDEQDDHSLEVNVRLLSKIKRILRTELRKQEKRPKMEFFQHSEEQNDISLELNDILKNPLFQQKIHEMDGRLKSAPEARGKRLIEKYAEALAISSSSSSPIINSFLPFFIACLLVCW